MLLRSVMFATSARDGSRSPVTGLVSAAPWRLANHSSCSEQSSLPAERRASSNARCRGALLPCGILESRAAPDGGGAQTISNKQFDRSVHDVAALVAMPIGSRHRITHQRAGERAPERLRVLRMRHLTRPPAPSCARAPSRRHLTGLVGLGGFAIPSSPRYTIDLLYRRVGCIFFSKMKGTEVRQHTQKPRRHKPEPTSHCVQGSRGKDASQGGFWRQASAPKAEHCVWGRYVAFFTAKNAT